MTRKKIALFMLPPLTQGGGAEKYFINLARNISDYGWESDIFTVSKLFFRIFSRIIYVLTFNPFASYDLSGKESEDYIKKQMGMAHWLRPGFFCLKSTLDNYDLIYTKNEIVDLLLLKIIGYKNLPPIIVGVHTPIFFPVTDTLYSKLHNLIYKSFLYKWLYSGVASFHASNTYSYELIKEEFKQKCFLVPYPFSLKGKNPKYINKNLTVNKGIFNILFLGRLSQQKGIDRLANLVKKLNADDKISDKIRINIFGSGAETEEKIILDLQKTYKNVKWFGHVDNQYVVNILERHQLLIAPSKWEVLPFNILEAQAVGIPVVSFNIPGPKDIIEDNVTGFIVNSEASFYEKVYSIIRGKHKFNQKIIQESIKNKYFPETIYNHLSNNFTEVLKQYTKNEKT